MQVFINGEPRQIAEQTTLSQLLEQLEMNPMFLAVEVNRVLVPRRNHSNHHLQQDDQLEIVTLVGGG